MGTSTKDSLIIDVDTQNGVPRIIVEVVTGEVQITGWDRPQIRVRSSETDEDTDISDLFALRKNGNEIWISVNHSGQGHKKEKRSGGWDIDGMIRQVSSAMRGITADLDISVPSTCDVEVRSASGDITISGVYGKVSANSASGSISFSDVQGSALIKSSAGDIEIDGFSGRLGVRTISGDIQVGAGEVNGLSIGSASGDIDVSASLTHDGEYDIQSVSGNVDLRVPVETGALAEIQTVSGDISCELAHESQKNGRRRQKLAINGGDGPTLRINTTSGDVQIGEWDGDPGIRTSPPLITEQLDKTTSGEQFRTEEGVGGQTVRLNTPAPAESSEMSILQAIERGELTVEEGLRKLGELSKRV